MGVGIMDIDFKIDTVFLKGFLDESVDFDAVKKVLLEAQESVGPGYLKVNFSEVRLANSIGILNWLNIVRLLNKVSICYSLAPKWLIAQLNMVPQLMGNNAVVESFEVPYYCDESDMESMKIFIVGKDILPKKDHYSNEDFPPIEIDGREYTLDVLPKNYFRFINENFEAFKGYFN